MIIELKKMLQERYSVLLTERDEFMSKANQKLGEYAGRLAELEEMFNQLNVTAAEIPYITDVPLQSEAK